MRNTLLYIEKRLSVTQWQISRKEGCAGRKQGRKKTRQGMGRGSRKQERGMDRHKKRDKEVLLVIVHPLSHVQLFVTSWMPGFPVFPSLLEFAQTQVHWVSDAIQPSHSLLPPSPLALNLSQHQGLWKPQLHQVRRPELGAFTSFKDHSSTGNESSFPYNNQPVKSHGHVAYCSPRIFLSHSSKEFLFACQWLTVAADSGLQLSTNPD